MKKYRLFALLSAVCIMLSACSGPGMNIADSISPPKPSGELYEIQKTLEASVGHGVDLVYPSSGTYRSAIVTQDIDSDGKYEVFSFYSTETDDKTTVMHLNYIRWIDGKWVSVSDIQVDSSSVESIEFVRLDKSNTPKILVNWNRYSATNKQLAIYSIDSGELDEVTSADFSVYSTCDFDSDGIFEIIAVHLDLEKQTAQASLLGVGQGGFSMLSSCSLDGTVSSYYKPVISQFTDGTKALFIDANKASGMITEVLCIREGVLSSAIPYTATGENVNTLRASSVRSGDFDSDGCIDIPTAQKLPMVSGSLEEDSAYMTTWNRFDGKNLIPQAHSVINFTDGYYLNIPDNWVGNIAVERNTDNRQRVFYRWDPVTMSVGEEVLRIQAVPLKTWESNREPFKGYSEYGRNSKTVFVAKHGNSALNLGEEYLKENFTVINPDSTEDLQKIV